MNIESSRDSRERAVLAENTLSAKVKIGALGWEMVDRFSGCKHMRLRRCVGKRNAGAHHEAVALRHRVLHHRFHIRSTMADRGACSGEADKVRQGTAQRDAESVLKATGELERSVKRLFVVSEGANVTSNRPGVIRRNPVGVQVDQLGPGVCWSLAELRLSLGAGQGQNRAGHPHT